MRMLGAGLGSIEGVSRDVGLHALRGVRVVYVMGRRREASMVEANNGDTVRFRVIC